MDLRLFFVFILIIVALIFAVNSLFLQEKPEDVTDSNGDMKCELYFESSPEIIELPCELAKVLDVPCDTYCYGLCNTSIDNLKRECIGWNLVNETNA